MSKAIHVPKWEPEFKRGKHVSALVIASRNSGKSYLTRYLLLCKLRDKYDLFVIFCSNVEEREKYLDIIPTELAYGEYKPHLIQTLFDRNEQRAQLGKPKLNVLVLFDDEVSAKIKNDDQILQTYTRGRHNGISCLFISQSHTLAAPTWRNNSDIVIIGRQNSAQARKAIMDNILSGSVDTPDGVSEKKLWQQIMRSHATANGDVLVVDYRCNDSDMLFRFRAPPGLE